MTSRAAGGLGGGAHAQPSGPRRREDASRRAAWGNPLSQLDLAILGAALALVSEKVGSAVLEVEANTPVETQADPQQGPVASQELSYQKALESLMGSNAEVMVLAALASELHKDVSRTLLGQNFSDFKPQVVSALKGPRAELASAEQQGSLELKAASTGDLLAQSSNTKPAAADSAQPEAVSQSQETQFSENAEKLQAASSKFLEAMRELFGPELLAAEERSKQPEDGEKVELAEVEEDATKEKTPDDVEVATSSTGGGFDPSFLGLLALAGGGGGGGGGGGFVSAAFRIGGVAIDGYVSNATVFWDQNNNFQLDAGEISSKTGADGTYSLSGVNPSSGGQIVILDDGIDTSTGGSVGMMAAQLNAANASSTMITPLTLLMAQGIDQSVLKTAFGVDDSIDLASFDPVAELTKETGSKEAAGTLLIKAQQAFAVINSVTALASASTDTATALESVANYLETNGVASLTATDGTAIEGMIRAVAPAYTDIASSAGAALAGVNRLMNEVSQTDGVFDPTKALDPSVRAAALVSQNDLVSQFKSLSQLDPTTAAAQAATKLGDFANTATLKTNFVEIYTEAISSQASSQLGVIAAVDEVTVLHGSASDLDLSKLIANDVNRGTGALSVTKIYAPTGVSIQDQSGVPLEIGTETLANDTTRAYWVVPEGATAVKILVTDASLLGVTQNLRYSVTNGNGESLGVIRTTIEPSTRTLSLKPSSSFEEDTQLSLADRINVSGVKSEGVSERLLIQTNESGFVVLQTGKAPVSLTKGTSVSFSPSTGQTLEELLSELSIVPPTDYSGTFNLNYKLASTLGGFSKVQSVETSDAVSVLAKADGDTPDLQLSFGASSFGDADEQLLPVVGQASPERAVNFRLYDPEKNSAGDASETRWIEFSNLPDGLELYVGAETQARVPQLGVVRVNEEVFGEALSIRFKATDALLEASYGILDEPILARVFNQEASTGSTSSSEQYSLNLDIGATYGLVVVAQPLVVSSEDVAALLGGIDIASIADGYSVTASIAIPNGYVLGRTIDGAFAALSTSPLVAGDLSVYTLTANSSAAALTLLDGLAVLPPLNEKVWSQTIPSAINATATISATKVGAQAIEVVKTVDLQFLPVPDGVSSYSPASEVVGVEDQSVSLYPLFFDATSGNPLAALTDPSEELVYVVSGLPGSARVVDSLDVPLGREVGTTIELTVAEARVAVIRLSDNESLASTISVSAYSREPGTSLSSSAVASRTVSLTVSPQADSPLLAVDSQLRGLYKTGDLATEFLSKSLVEIPAVASLLDTDGSETLWVKLSLTPKNSAKLSLDDLFGNFEWSGASAASIHLNAEGYWLVAANQLSGLRLSQIDGPAFDGTMTVEAVSVDSLGMSVSTASEVAALLNNPTSAGSTSIGITSADIELEFLTPALKPTLSVTDRDWFEVEGDYYLDLTLSLANRGDSDLLTFLVTGAPENLDFALKSGDTFAPFGIKADVPGVWVLDGTLFPSGTTTATLRAKLPGHDPQLSAAPDLSITAFAVDKIGVTNAQSESASVSLRYAVGESAGDGDPLVFTADPVFISLDGDLPSFASSVQFDINADGSQDTLAWLEQGSAVNAPVLVLKEAGFNPNAAENLQGFVLDGSDLVTEFLDGNPFTHAVDDLKLFDDNRDGLLTQDELGTGMTLGTVQEGSGRTPWLWFDTDADGRVDAGEFADLEEFTVDLNQFDSLGTREGNVVVAGKIDPGGLSGSYERVGGQVADLSGARLFDVFLPVTYSTSSAGVTTLDSLSVSGLEDARDGISLGELFPTLAQPNGEKMPEGANVLLTIRAEYAGVSFNLSQGARLEGQPTETWLVSWDGTTPISVFAAENFSGPIDLSVKATVVEGLTSYSYERDVNLAVVPVADRPSFSFDSRLSATESDTSLTLALGNLSLSTPDTGESLSLTIFTPDNLPAGTVLLFKGQPISPASVGNPPQLAFSVEGPVNAGELSLQMPAYASGTFQFQATARSVDGASVRDLPLSSFSVNVTPVAQGAKRMELLVASGASEIAENTATSNVWTPVELKTTLADPDGSERIASVEVLLRGIPASAAAGSASIRVGSQVFTFEAATAEAGFSSVGDLIVRIPRADIPSSMLAVVVGTDLVSTLAADLQLPAYFDGQISLQSRVVTSESTDSTKRSTSISEAVDLDVVGAADGVASLVTQAQSTFGGQAVALDQLITSLATHDADEHMLISLALPAGVILQRQTGLEGQPPSYEAVASNQFVISSQTELSAYRILLPDAQTNFSVGLSVQSFEGTRDAVNPVLSSATQRSVSVLSTPILSPVLVTANGQVFPDEGLVMGPDGQQSLDLGVLLGTRLNPSQVSVVIGAVGTNSSGASVPLDGLSLLTGNGVVIAPSLLDGLFRVNASALAQGPLQLRYADPTQELASPTIELAVSATAVYASGEKVTKRTVELTVPFAQRPIIGTPEDDQPAANLVSVFEDAEFTEPFGGLVINDGQAATPDMEIFLKFASFSSADANEAHSLVLSGMLLGADSRLTLLDSAGAPVGTPLQATQVSNNGGFKFELDRGLGESAAFGAKLSLAKTSSGFGSKTLVATAKTTEGVVSNVELVDTERLVVTSTIPPTPSVGLGIDDAPFVGLPTEIALSAVVRVPGLNAGHVVEFLTPNFTLLGANADGTKQPILPVFQFDSDSNAFSVVRLSHDEFLAAKIQLPTQGGDPLDLRVRVGTQDGFVNDNAADGLRYVYSRIEEAHIALPVTSSGGVGSESLILNPSTGFTGTDANDFLLLEPGSIPTAALSGGVGRDTLSFEKFAAADALTIDLAFGKALLRSSSIDVAGFEAVVGTAGNDVIVGDGNSITALSLRGGAGDDYIVGGGGDDILEGGAGNDILVGGGGQNTFVFAGGSGVDRILDFDVTKDKILLANTGLDRDLIGALPTEIEFSAEGSDLRDLRVSGPGINVVLVGMAASQVAVAQAVVLRNDVDLLAPFLNDPSVQLPFIPAQLVEASIGANTESSYRNDFFGDERNFDDIGSALNVIADARYGDYIAAGNNSPGLIGAMNTVSSLTYKGLSGGQGNDVLVADDRDSVLWGGHGGSDLLLGGAGKDTLIGTRGLVAGETDVLSGATGADQFLFVINPSEVSVNSVYGVFVEDFNRFEGDRILYSGNIDTGDIEISEVVSDQQTVSFEGAHGEALNVVFDLSFARTYDANFSLRMGDFDKV